MYKTEQYHPRNYKNPKTLHPQKPTTDMTKKSPKCVTAPKKEPHQNGTMSTTNPARHASNAQGGAMSPYINPTKERGMKVQ